MVEKLTKNSRDTSDIVINSQKIKSFLIFVAECYNQDVITLEQSMAFLQTLWFSTLKCLCDRVPSQISDTLLDAMLEFTQKKRQENGLAIPIRATLCYLCPT
jgi:hypothetical protein